MARKNESPQKAAMREMMRGYLKDNDIRIKDGTDVNAVMRDMMFVLLEGVLDEELDEELGYSSMITKTRIPITAGTATPQKPCTPAMGIWKWLFHVTETVSMSPSLSKNIRIL